MSQKQKSGLLYAAGITLAMLGLVSQSAIAQEAPAPAAESSADSLTVVRDPVTGQLRHANAAEQASLKSQNSVQSLRSVRVAPKQFQQKAHANGARGIRLTEEFMSSAVAVRNADGSVGMQCFDSHDAAKTAVETGHVHTTKVETE